MAKKKLDQSALLSEIKNLIEKASKEYEVPPYQVSPTQFWSIAGTAVKEWQVRKIGGFAAIKQLLYPPQMFKTDVTDALAKDEQRKEGKLYKINLLNASFEQMIREMSPSLFKGRVKPIKIKKSSSKKTQRVVNVILSDLHIGSDISKEETGYENFGVKEEARRLAALTKQICSYKHQYRDTTKLVVYLIGDIIQGNLHDARDGAPQAEQFSRALHILSQMCGHLSANFKEVEIHCATGNHGRNKARHFDRAVHQKWDSVETLLYMALRSSCSELKNVKFSIPKTPFNKIDVLGHKVFVTHGDTVMKPGMPGKAIQMKNLENQINKINAGLPDTQEYAVFAVGHVHTPSMTFLDNGCVMITNGCMVPVDEFAVSIGVIESHCGQWIWESIKGHPVGDARLIKVGRHHDVDESLDEIIKPWSQL